MVGKIKPHVTDTTKYCIFPDEAIAVIHVMCTQEDSQSHEHQSSERSGGFSRQNII